MGRHKEFDQQQALTAARDLFWEKGYERTSLSELLQVMQIHRKSFYDTFGSKRKIFLLALQDYHDEVGRVMRERVAREDTGCGKIRAVFASSRELDAGAGRGCLIVNTIAEGSEEDPGIRELVSGWIDEIREYFLAFLQRDRDAGLLPQDTDLQREAERLSNALIGFSLQLRLGRSPQELDALMEAILPAGTRKG